MKYLIRTFGCQMNKHDSEHIAGILVNCGYRETDQVEQADLIVFNTCTVRKHADQRLYGQVDSLRTLKKDHPDLLIIIAGCLAQSQRDQLLKRFPHVDIVCGTHNLFALEELIGRIREDRKQICQIFEEPAASIRTSAHRESRFKAWLPITTGCNNNCTYCIVPIVRGREISRPLEEIIEEAHQLGSDGVLEITLLGQNVNSYGRDLYSKPVFPELLSRLDKIDGVSRIRFTTSHPKDLSVEVLDKIAISSKICHHIHLPFQSGSTRILDHMNRGYSKEDYLSLTGSIKERLPFASLTTDVMVGFPGETEQDFQDTLDVVEQVRFDQAFTFIFSKREGTPAVGLTDDVPYQTKLERLNRLVDIQTKIIYEENQKTVGQTVDILVDGISKKGGLLQGRTGSNKVVNFEGDPGLVGQIIPVKIVSAQTWSLIGTVI